jgi:hypothetical protein
MLTIYCSILGFTFSFCIVHCCHVFIQFPDLTLKHGYFQTEDRAYSFNETNVKLWFEQFIKLCAEHHICRAYQFGNYDEVSSPQI